MMLIFRCRVSNEISQFLEGLGHLWIKVKAIPGLMKPLFVYERQKLTLDAIKSLYGIVWSPSGSIRRQEEESTIYNFECFMQDCEG